VCGLLPFYFLAKSIWVCYGIVAQDSCRFAVSGGAEATNTRTDPDFSIAFSFNPWRRICSAFSLQG
jgi:hypothetical protein